MLAQSMNPDYTIDQNNEITQAQSQSATPNNTNAKKSSSSSAGGAAVFHFNKPGVEIESDGDNTTYSEFGVLECRVCPAGFTGF